MPQLPDVKLTIRDGGLGILANLAALAHAKVGVSSAGTANLPVLVTDQDTVAALFGTGPLVDALLDSFAAGARSIVAVRAASDVAGVVGAITKTGTGTGTLAAAGAPLDAYDIIVEILSTGTVNVATFRYSLDGGDTWSEAITVPAAPGTYLLPGTGITLTFTADVGTPDTSFVDGDTHSFSATAPSASVANLGAAVDALLASAFDFEFVHVAMPTDNTVWTALATKATAAETAYRYIHFVCETRRPDAAETIDEWITAITTMAAAFTSSRVAVVAGRFELTDPATLRIVDRNGAGLYAGRLSAIPVQRSPGRVLDGPLPGTISLNPAGLTEAQIATLDVARFTTFRQYVGKSGHYVTDGRMMAAADSDFGYVERRRVMDKACRLVRAAALEGIQAEATEAGLRDLEARLSAPLNAMAGAGEVASGQVEIPRDQDLTAGTLTAKVRIVPIDTVREISVDIGFEAGGANQ